MSTKSFKFYAGDLLNIALPIIMGNLGFILIGVGDVLIAGRHSTDTLAAISIATAITNCIQTFGIGIIASVSPLLSNYRGQQKTADKYFMPTIKFALFLAIIVMIGVFAAIPLVDLLNFPTNLVPIIKQYMFITAFATFGGYLHFAVKEYLQAFEIVLFPNLLTIFSVFLNVFLNIILVFGVGFIPSLGAVGLALASLITRYFMGFVLLIYCLKVMGYSDCKDFEYYKSLMKIGIPISCAILVEFVAFNSVAIFMGRISGLYAAAQNIICTMTTVSFMIPLALSNAIAVKVGFENGSGNIIGLKRYAFAGTAMSVCFMAFSGLIFATFPRAILGLFTSDINLINISIPIVYLLSVYQVFDGLQVSLSGIFKGIKKTKTVMISNFVAYWLIAIPLGLIFAFKFNFNLKGFWYALFISSVILCSIMIIVLFRYLRKVVNTK